jgi:ketosteroid isomerase-like protein
VFTLIPGSSIGSSRSRRFSRPAQGWNNEVVTLDETHLAGNAAWAFGEYTLSGQGPSEALYRAGRWSMVFERESDGWKIRLLIANVAPPSPPPAAPAASK